MVWSRRYGWWRVLHIHFPVNAILLKITSRTLANIAMNTITTNTAMEIISHEAIVCEAYRDSVDVWTWGIGITTASGHDIYPRYVDNPQPLRHCLDIFVGLLKTTYAPVVCETFPDHCLSENQFAAALSFHYNTGSVHRAEWARLWKDGQIEMARTAFMNWSKPAAIIPRRLRERDLFFDGIWSNNGTATIYPVRKPSYQPDLENAETVDIAATLEDLLRS